MACFKSQPLWQIRIGGGVLVLMAVLAALAPLFWPHSPGEMDLLFSLKGPTVAHPFGWDENGQDLLSQVLYGIRVSMGLALVVVFVTLVLGVGVGCVSAMAGGIWDYILMRMVDMAFGFPRFLLALAVLAMWGASWLNLVVAMSLTGWAGFARLVRAEVMHLKQEEYVLSAVTYGAGPGWILIRHIGPNLLGVLGVQVILSLVGVVIAEAGLSFLGLGLPPDVPSLGRLLSAGRDFLEEAPHLILFPGAAVFGLVFGFQLCGEALRDLYFPQTSPLN